MPDDPTRIRFIRLTVVLALAALPFSAGCRARSNVYGARSADRLTPAATGAYATDNYFGAPAASPEGVFVPPASADAAGAARASLADSEGDAANDNVRLANAEDAESDGVRLKLRGMAAIDLVPETRERDPEIPREVGMRPTGLLPLPSAPPEASHAADSSTNGAGGGVWRAR